MEIISLQIDAWPAQREDVEGEKIFYPFDAGYIYNTKLTCGIKLRQYLDCFSGFT